MSEFNQALLAKQAWQILNNPSALITRIYKARYFAHREFLTCGVGKRPSYAWKSIIFGRELLQKGLMKGIGNGRSTAVWCDKWIMDTQPRRPVSKEHTIDLNLNVSELIDAHGSWDMSKLNTLFPIADVHRILSICPSLTNNDFWFWAYTKSGAYVVKSGSVFIEKEKHLFPTSLDESNEQKSRVWNIKTVPKIKFFFWRVLSRRPCGKVSVTWDTCQFYLSNMWCGSGDDLSCVV